VVTIEINGVETTLPHNTTLSKLIEQCKLSNKTNAVAINNVVPPKSEWDSIYVAQGDVISIFTLVAGG
jgi:thiamine biosynthesis protein ThiS